MNPFFMSDPASSPSSDGLKPGQAAGKEPAGDDFADGPEAVGKGVDTTSREPLFRMFQPDAPLHPHAFRPVAELITDSPTIYLSVDAFKRMLLFVEIAGKEVGWLGTVEEVQGGDFLIDKVFLLEQEVTATETELSVDGQNKLVMQLIEQGDQGLEQANRLRFWGHSHVRMGTWPSYTDERTMQRFGREGLPWYIRGIFNKHGKADFAIHYYDKGYRIKDVPWAVLDAAGGRVLDGKHFNVHGGSGTVVPATVAPNSVPGSDAVKAPDGTPAKPVESAASGSGSSVHYRGLPEVLRPDEQLRKEVLAEFAAKVTERAPVVISWLEAIFGSSSESAGDAPPTPAVSNNESAGAKPASAADGAEKHNAAQVASPSVTSPPQTPTPPPQQKKSGVVNPPARKVDRTDKGEEKGFWDWLLGR